jgi:rhodanese-related sulfurtransferase
MPTLPIEKLEVTGIAAAQPPEALFHFERLLSFETDCWDVHASPASREPGFVLLDVRSPEAFAAGHVPGAVNLPHRRINERNLGGYQKEALFVVYCAGPHCNGADEAAVRLPRMGRAVKKMIGGVEGWKDEGFDLAKGAAESDWASTASPRSSGVPPLCPWPR